MAFEGALADFNAFAQDFLRADGMTVDAGIHDDPKSATGLVYSELGVGSQPSADGTPQLRRVGEARMPLTGAFDSMRRGLESEIVSRIGAGEKPAAVLQDAGDRIIEGARARIDAGLQPGLAESTRAGRNSPYGDLPLKNTGTLYDNLKAVVSDG